jgi:curved DNA-binding protein CbpA
MTQESLSEDDLVCLEIIKKSNYYQILEISSEASPDQIKKSYKSKALKLHPDKNKSRFSQEAFQKLSKAFVCLSSEALRKIYDETGNEEIPDQTIHQSFDPDFASKVFSEVFSDYRKDKKRTPIYKSYLTKCLLLQLIPIFLILFLTMYTAKIENSSEFSFSMTSFYNVKKLARPANITFFISAELNRELNDTSLKDLEGKVEVAYEKFKRKMKDLELKDGERNDEGDEEENDGNFSDLLQSG